MKPEDSDKNFIFKKKNCQILVRKKIHYYHYYINYCSSSFEVSLFPLVISIKLLSKWSSNRNMLEIISERTIQLVSIVVLLYFKKVKQEVHRVFVNKITNFTTKKIEVV